MKAVWAWISAWLVWGLMLAAVLGYGGHSALFMLGAMTFILLQGILAKWAGPKRVSVHRRYSAAMPSAGQPVNMELLMKLEGGFPPLWLKLRDEFGGGCDEPAEHWIFAGFRRQLSFAYRIEGLPRGLYGLEKMTVSHTDLFGWFSYKRLCSVTGLLPVLPAPGWGPDGIGGGTGSELENISMPEERHVITGSPGYDVRGYLPGDPLKAINWKMSARRGELIVRAPEEETDLAAIILLDTDLKSYQAEGTGSKAASSTLILPAAEVEADDRRGDEAARMFERAVSTAAFLLEDAALSGHAVLFRHGGMDRLCRWNPHSLGEDGPASLAAVVLAAAGYGGPDMLADALRISPGVPVTVITGIAGGRLAAAAQHVGAGAEVRVISCSDMQGAAPSAVGSPPDQTNRTPNRKEAERDGQADGAGDANVPA